MLPATARPGCDHQTVYWNPDARCTGCGHRTFTIFSDPPSQTRELPVLLEARIRRHEARLRRIEAPVRKHLKGWL